MPKYTLAILLIALQPYLIACGGDRNSDQSTNTDVLTNARQCREGDAEPISVDAAMSVIRKNGFSVLTEPDADLCSSEDTIAVFDNTTLATVPYERIVRTEGHLRCGLRKKPIYKDQGRIITSRYAGWNELRYQNLECGLEMRGAGAASVRLNKLREVFNTLKREIPPVL